MKRYVNIRSGALLTALALMFIMSLAVDGGVFRGAAFASAASDACRVCHGNGPTLEVLTLHHNLANPPAGGCTACHNPNLSDKECANCHGPTAPWPVAPHDGTNAVAAHDKAVLDSSACAQCHQNNVVPVHVGVTITTGPNTGVVMNCATCHYNASAVVLQAIATGRGPNGQVVYCSTCHGPSNHEQQHDKTMVDQTVCLQCHKSNVVTEHATWNVACAPCHSSTDPKIQAAIASGVAGQTVYCSACHGTTDHSAAHDKALIDAAVCTQCHSSNVVTEHAAHNLGCAVCHSSTDPKVIQTINTGKGTTGTPVYCSNCHGVTDHASAHDKALIDNAACAQCHNSNVVTEHAAHNLGCAICHSSTDPKIIQTINTGKGPNGTPVYCSNCHGATDHTNAHDKALIDNATCQQCHNANVVPEHASHGLDCSVCHSSTNATVQQVIKTGIAGTAVYCYSCHGPTDHAAAHKGITTADCARCHDANVVTGHSTCATCHSSTNQVVINTIKSGIAGSSVSCSTCHSAFSIHWTQHDKANVNGNVVVQHETNGAFCNACHLSTNSIVIVAINKGQSGQAVACSDCHGGNQSPVASAGPDQTVKSGQAVTLSGAGSSDPDGTIASYAWNFGDGTTGSGVTVTHTYSADGIYNAVLTVTDKLGATGTDVAVITVGTIVNQPPVASAGPNQTTQAGKAITLSGAGSTDPDGTIAGYAWNFGDGTTGSGVSVTHTYATAGTYNAVLTVTDNKGAQSSATVVITVTAVPVSSLDQARYITRLTSRTGSDGTSYTDITAKLTDNVLTDQYAITGTSPYSEISMRLNRDANTCTGVFLRLNVNSLYNGRAQTLRIYPYSSNGSSLNTAYYKDLPVSATGWVEVDVTTLAGYMKGYGWMKFRVTCTTTRCVVGEGSFRIQ